MSQLLLDSNCLLLILKYFGSQDVNAAISERHELPYRGLFGLQHPDKRSGDAPATIKLAVGDDEVDVLTEYSWRNFFSSINYVRVLQKLCKGKPHRNIRMTGYKSGMTLKKLLKVPHDGLRLVVLKVLKSQVPYCGRKWRQANMKIITSIYLYCRPLLRDDWLSSTEADGDLEDASPAEFAMRALTQFHHVQRYPEQMKTLGLAPALPEDGFFAREVGE